MRRPEATVIALAALAWVALAFVHGAPRAGGAAGLTAVAGHGGHAHTTVAAMAGVGAPGLGQRVVLGSLSWALMAVAMMAPATVPAVRHVAANSFRWRRRRAVATFVVTYLLVWVAFGVAAVTAFALALGGEAGGPVVVAALFALAAAWHLTPQRRRLLGGCRRAIPLRPRGWRASAACARFGLRHGASCVGACWALMLPMAVLRTGHLGWGAVLTAVVVTERLLRVGPRLRAPAATGLAASAAVVLIAA